MAFLNVTKNKEIRLGKLEKHDLPWEPNLLYIAVGELPVQLLA